MFEPSPLRPAHPQAGKPKPIIEDDRLWADINRTLYDDVEGRFRSNRMAALAAGGVQRDDRAAELGGAGAGASGGLQPFERPEMPADVRKTLADFYRCGCGRGVWDGVRVCGIPPGWARQRRRRAAGCVLCSVGPRLRVPVGGEGR